eukprot:TRINITY_DN9667_c0_g1_i1.p1 TRINITY_DN9667_c0_g1~~TRINITY_DN9667_c0_g1_i1.p1  ORF type:complete len:96 (+),score=10.01 TRINITY_DN9667_c0_g1_i1:124-411(+)
MDELMMHDVVFDCVDKWTIETIIPELVTLGFQSDIYTRLIFAQGLIPHLEAYVTRCVGVLCDVQSRKLKGFSASLTKICVRLFYLCPEMINELQS